jgi:hypothetical protein
MADHTLLTLQELLYEPLFDFTEPNIPEMAEGPIYIAMTTPTSAHGSSAQPSPAAAAFIAEHTVTVLDAPTSDECPVCMENYGPAATCLQIKNIGDCAHRFCKKCVSALVNEHSGADLRCPNCRAVWIPSATNVAIRAPARVSNRYSAAAQAFVPGGRVSIDLAEEDDYDAQVQSFNQAAREIEDVRARARGTQMSRGQRSQEMEGETTRRRAAERESRHLEARARINEEKYDVPRRFRLPHTLSRTPAQPTQTPIIERPSVANNFNFPRPARSFGAPFTVPAAVPSTPRAATPPRTPRADRERQVKDQHFTVLSNRSQDVQREQALNVREIELNDRVVTLNDRETMLNGRATSLGVHEDRLNQQEARNNKRLTNALAKEKAAKTREERVEKMVQLAQKQKDEMEKLIKRQREEMDRMMR